MTGHTQSNQTDHLDVALICSHRHPRVNVSDTDGDDGRRLHKVLVGGGCTEMIVILLPICDIDQSTKTCATMMTAGPLTSVCLWLNSTLRNVNS